MFGRYSGMVGLISAIAGICLGYVWGDIFSIGDRFAVGFFLTNVIINLYLARYAINRIATWLMAFAFSGMFAILSSFASSRWGWKPIYFFPFMIGELWLYYRALLYFDGARSTASSTKD